MKRGTPRNPKVLHLCNLLKVKVPTAVGYLELLWHFTAEFAPQGDIGRFDDRWIEAALFWTGRAGHLIHCLTVARWLDDHPKCRLAVHDWHDHADDSVKKRLIRSGLQFVEVAEKVTVQNPVSDRTLSGRVADNGGLPEPEPKPKPEPKPEPEEPPTPLQGDSSTPPPEQFSLSAPVVQAHIPAVNGKGKKRPPKAMTEEQRDWFSEYLSVHPRNTIQAASATRLWAEKVVQRECFDWLMACLRREITGDTTYIQGPHNWLASHLELYANGVQASMKANTAEPAHRETAADQRRRETVAGIEAIDRLRKLTHA